MPFYSIVNANKLTLWPLSPNKNKHSYLKHRSWMSEFKD